MSQPSSDHDDQSDHRGTESHTRQSTQGNGTLGSGNAIKSSKMEKAYVTFSQPVTARLDDKNFLVWRQQVEAVIKGHRLHRFLVNPEIPMKFLTVDDCEKGKVSEEFLRWEQQDQLLLSWLLQSLSESLAMKMIKCAHSYQLWDAIHTHFTKLTKAKGRQLRTELRNSKKGTRSIAEYLVRIQTIIDALQSIGSHVTPQEHADVVLAGLPEEYKPFVITVNTRLEPYTVDEIESLLITHEALLEQMSVPDTLSANVVQGREEISVHTGSQKTSDSNQVPVQIQR